MQVVLRSKGEEILIFHTRATHWLPALLYTGTGPSSYELSSLLRVFILKTPQTLQKQPEIMCSFSEQASPFCPLLCFSFSPPPTALSQSMCSDYAYLTADSSSAATGRLISEKNRPQALEQRSMRSLCNEDLKWVYKQPKRRGGGKFRGKMGWLIPQCKCLHAPPKSVQGLSPKHFLYFDMNSLVHLRHFIWLVDENRLSGS